MGIFRQFPYSNFHDMNMDELIRTVKEIQIGFEKGKEEYKKDITEMFNYIKEYLHNIHIPTKTSELTNDSGFITSSDVPAVNNGKLTIKRNGTTVKTFTANQSSNVTADISVPVAVSELTNDSGFVTQAAIPTKTSDLTNDSGFVTATPAKIPITNQIPTIISEAIFNGGYYTVGDIVIVQISGTVSGTFAANDYWSAAASLPVPKDCPAILQVNSTGNDHVEASAVINASGVMILRSGSTALSGKTITIIGAYIKA